MATDFEVDWDNAYKAWKASGLSRRCFLYSETFKEFVISTGMPSEDTARTHFRQIRDRQRMKNDKRPLAVSVDEQLHIHVQNEAEQEVQIIRLDAKKLAVLQEDNAAKRPCTSKRLRQVVIYLPTGQTVMFESRNAELFALRLLGCRQGASL